VALPCRLADACFEQVPARRAAHTPLIEAKRPPSVGSRFTVVPQSVSPSDLILPPADASLEEINILLHV
jgi:hypothetical protein